MTFLFIDIALDIAQVLGFILVFLGNLSGINFSCWIASTIFLIMFIFVFFAGVGRRLIGISDSKVLGGHIFILILIILIGFVFFS